MKLKKLGATLFFGMGLSIAVSANAFGNWDACLVDCIQKKQACLASGTSSSICNNFYNLCRWNCGPAQ